MTTQSYREAWVDQWMASKPEPADDEFDAMYESLRSRQPSAKVVLSSIFVLAALGLSTFLLMYAMVHRGPSPVAQMPIAGAAAPQADTPLSSALAAPLVDAPRAVPAERLSPLAVPAETLAPLPPALPTEGTAATAQARAAAPPRSAPPRRAASAPVRASAPSVGPMHTPIVVRMEPEPVMNPYDRPASTTPAEPELAQPATAPERAAPPQSAVESSPYDAPIPEPITGDPSP